MDKFVVAQLGLEGGSATIMGQFAEGRWKFWNEGTSIALDENFDEDWREWVTDPSEDLGAAVPSCWLVMAPMMIHPDFVGWFRDNYEAALAALKSSERDYVSRFRSEEWQQIFARTQSASRD